LLLELTSPCADLTKEYRRFLEVLADDELVRLIADMGMTENEELARKARWITRRIQTQLDNQNDGM
jgi:hypothetical protein